MIDGVIECIYMVCVYACVWVPVVYPTLSLGHSMEYTEKSDVCHTGREESVLV